LHVWHFPFPQLICGFFYPFLFHSEKLDNMEGYIAEIRLFAANFAPRNWAYCQGQLISISQNSALFSLLGTTYGGNGIQTFGLPNFASRTARGAGSFAGMPTTSLGEMSGYESVTLLPTQMPAHTHTGGGTLFSPCSTNPGGDGGASNSYPANTAPVNLYASTSNGTMGVNHPVGTVQIAGGSQAHSNIQPSLGMNYIICMYGIYPSRD
jgi:microcystin-dependent protein